MKAALRSVLIALTLSLAAAGSGTLTAALRRGLERARLHQSVSRAAAQGCESVPAFADENLAARVRSALGLGADEALTCAGASTLTELTAEDADIRDLRGIEALSGLTELHVSGNPIADLGPLRGLESLEVLFLYGGAVRDLSPLRNLERLRVLHIGNNAITDIEPLRHLSGLQDLSITYNSVSDLDPLSGLTGLEVLRVYDNPISDIGAMRGLTNLTELHIHDLPLLSDIRPLIENAGLGEGDRVILMQSDISCRDAAALAAKGVSVSSGCLGGVPIRWWGLVVILGGLAAAVAAARRNRRRQAQT